MGRKRKSSLIKIRKPRVRLTPKGIKVSKPTARIGGKTGFNISSKGISASTRTKLGTISSRKGRSTFLKPKRLINIKPQRTSKSCLPCCSIFILPFGLLVFLTILLIC